jgi:hypothetical protein
LAGGEEGDHSTAAGAEGRGGAQGGAGVQGGGVQGGGASGGEGSAGEVGAGGVSAGELPAPLAEALSGSVTLAVSTGARQERVFHWVYVAGEAVAGGEGPARPGPGGVATVGSTGADRGAGQGGGPAAVTLAIACADLAEVVSERLPLSVAFMRGRLKAAGDGELLLAFLASSESPSTRVWLSRLSESVRP